MASTSSTGGSGRSPKDTFITVYGRMPVQEVLTDPELTVDKLVVADSAGGGSLERLLRLAGERGVPVERASAHRVKVLAGNGKHDQGVIADVVAPGLRNLEEFVEQCPADARVLVLDGVTNPGNVGMIIRTATAAGLTGIVVPSAGSAALGPLVIKASAGVAYRASIVRCRQAAEAVRRLRDAGFTTYGLAGSATTDLYGAEFGGRCAFVLGNETDGMTAEVSGLVDRPLSIPMAGGVDSLNVASAAAVVCFELVRRARSGA
jgi:23S rRNA (guanosine2251-2'-O)-methyltransferase